MEAFFIIVPLIVLLLIGWAFASGQKDLDKINERQKKREARLKELKDTSIKEYSKFRNRIINTYGEPTKEFSLRKDWKDWDKVENHMFIFDNSNVIVINGKELPYSSIIGFALTDDTTSKTTSFTDGTTSSSTGNVIKRAMVGGVIGGGIGAIAGASTSKRNIDAYSESTTTTNHDYTISVQVNDMANPIIEIKIKNQSSKVQEIIACLNIILKNSN